MAHAELFLSVRFNVCSHARWVCVLECVCTCVGNAFGCVFAFAFAWVVRFVFGCVDKSGVLHGARSCKPEAN